MVDQQRLGQLELVGCGAVGHPHHGTLAVGRPQVAVARDRLDVLVTADDPVAAVVEDRVGLLVPPHRRGRAQLGALGDGDALGQAVVVGEGIPLGQAHGAVGIGTPVSERTCALRHTLTIHRSVKCMAESEALGLALVRVLVIGSGAREHALLLALRQDPEVEELAVAPGNAGTAIIADQYEVDVTSGDAIAQLAQRIGADLVVIGPEVPLVLGVADTVRAAGIACFGPTKDAARIEGSKSFAKDVMTAAGVRTATSEIVDNPAHLDSAIDRFGPPASDPAWVVKDDGLAAGKGVIVPADRDAARAHAASLLDAGHPVLLESFLDGPEVSMLCIVDGETVVPLLPAQDFKRVGDNDVGPNTGGMGAYAPLPWLPDEVTEQIVSSIVQPVVAQLVRRGRPFSGVLYAGLAITSAGPAVVEFNCRFGDPETQAVLALLDSPLGQPLHAGGTGTLAGRG